MDVARTEAADAELVRMIERRSKRGEVDPDEIEPGYAESVRRYNSRRREEMRAAWCASSRAGRASEGRPHLPRCLPRRAGRGVPTERRRSMTERAKPADAAARPSEAPEHYALPRGREVEEERAEQRSTVTAHARSGVS